MSDEELKRLGWTRVHWEQTDHDQHEPLCGETTTLYTNWDRLVRDVTRDHLLREILLAASFHAARERAEARQLPTALEFLVDFFLSRERRDDVWNDMCDLYANKVGKYGRTGAAAICLKRIASATAGSVLDFLMRIAEIVGKFRGAK